MSQFHLWQFADAAAEELLGELRELKELLDSGLLSQEDFADLKTKLLRGH